MCRFRTLHLDRRMDKCSRDSDGRQKHHHLYRGGSESISDGSPRPSCRRIPKGYDARTLPSVEGCRVVEANDSIASCDSIVITKNNNLNSNE